MGASFVLKPGREAPLGAFLDSEGCNFALWAPDASRVTLCLFDETDKESVRIPLTERKGHYWYGYVTGIRAGQRYGWRVGGPQHPEQGLLFDEQKLLLDPYSRQLSRPLLWDETLYEGDSQRMMSKSVVVDEHFDWQGVTK